MSIKKFYVLLTGLCFCSPINILAQFNTIEKKTESYIILQPEFPEEAEALPPKVKKKVIRDTMNMVDPSEYRRIREKYRRVRRPKQILQNIQTNQLNQNRVKTTNSTSKTEGLTLESLYEEILKNNIKYPKIVLAQAILETGWFKSSVCRNKGNLFGLVNPRTKTYYEFNDWRESVKAYYDKVQYRYKGGNYLLWLKKIGYAEDKGYIQAVARVLKGLKIS